MKKLVLPLVVLVVTWGQLLLLLTCDPVVAEMLTCARPNRISRQSALFRNERVARQLPCKFEGDKNYCSLPGEKYPWNPVRRWIAENRGLMRRMYGELRETSLVRQKRQFSTSDEFLMPPSELDMVPMASNIEDDELEDLFFQFKPLRGNSIHERSESKIPDEIDPNSEELVTLPRSEILDISSEKETSPLEEIKKTRQNDKLTFIGPLEESKILEEISILKKSEPEEEVLPENEATLDELATTLSEVSDENFTTTVIEETTTEKMGENFQDFTSAHEKLVENIELTTSAIMEDIGTTIEPEVTTEDPDSNLRSTEEFQLTQMHGHEFNQEVKKSSQNSSLSDQKEEQDQDLETQIITINACETREEVVAPYWANSTRGETLALLNLHPFEQYVHWEKCKNPGERGRCHGECRCEQEYRLHRLLAFDPENECRGIFSDWFRFPSCCVCRCYVTVTRKRRQNHKHWLYKI